VVGHQCFRGPCCLHIYAEVYNILGIPSLLYGREIWALKEKDIRPRTAEMKFMRGAAGYSLLEYRIN
jgi:hypothetical protein